MEFTAIVNGQPFGDLPEDLYIPPEALEIFLETFEGPLDLLLYLIRKQNLDILNIPVASITEQYMAYVHLMKSLKLELAADYLVMAAMLAEIKSSILLPKPPVTEGEEEDPRARLVRRLLDYEQMKQASEDLFNLPQLDKEFFWANAFIEKSGLPKTIQPIELSELIAAMKDVLQRCALRKHHEVRFEPISVRERMSQILEYLASETEILFIRCFKIEEGRIGVVATFIAMLELLKNGQIHIIQPEAFGPIMLGRLPRDSSTSSFTHEHQNF